MDPAGRVNPPASSTRCVPFEPQMSALEPSGAPPAYVAYEQPSTSRSSFAKEQRTVSASKNTSNPSDFYYSSSSPSPAKTSRSLNIKTMVAVHDPEHERVGCRAAPDYTEGEFLSEKAPRAQATQTHQSITHQPRRSPCSRTSNGALPHAQYPPTASREEDTSLCACFNSLPPKVKLWLSFGAWIVTSIGFLLAVAFWKTEVFTALDNLSGWLVREEYTGYAYMFALIVLTTIPPFPLYSTLMMLAGYTWGTWTGFVISYASSLFGAIVVYFISRHFFGTSLISLLRHMPSFARTVRAVARNPKLLFLIRLAPYPYNMMNVLLAACPSLRWKTYISCTAISLLKVVIHTSIGSGIRSFKSYHGVSDGATGGEMTESEKRSSELAKYSTIVGGILCVLLFFYLSYLARKAVDSELEDEDIYECPNNSLLPIYRQLDDIRPPYSPHRHQREPSTVEERMAFLSPIGNDSDSDDDSEMSETRLGGSTLVGVRQSSRR